MGAPPDCNADNSDASSRGGGTSNMRKRRGRAAAVAAMIAMREEKEAGASKRKSGGEGGEKGKAGHDAAAKEGPLTKEKWRRSSSHFHRLHHHVLPLAEQLGDILVDRVPSVFRGGISGKDRVAVR